MSELRLNPLTGRWVAITVGRASRPHDLSAPMTSPEPGGSCPFCPGNESQTLPAVHTHPDHGTWSVRVVPNRYPVVSGGEPASPTDIGPNLTQVQGTGLHEVIVYSANHDADWSELGTAEIAAAMQALRSRLAEHARHPSLESTHAFVNSGMEAGASLAHPHGQLLSLPFVPSELQAELEGFERHAGSPDAAGASCLLCSVGAEERDRGVRMVHSTAHLDVICPFWSATPYEMLVIPRAHSPHLHGVGDAPLVALGTAIRDGLRAVDEVAGKGPYNIVFHTAPHRGGERFHSHVHVIPHLAFPGGLEIGTGVATNSTAPEDAAGQLRRAWPSDSGDGRSLDATSSSA